MSKKYKVAIAAAGTAGHINPGLAIAKQILKQRNDTEIFFIGTDRGLENELVPNAGLRLRKIEAYGFSITPTPENIRRQYINFFVSKKMAEKVLKEENVDIVIGTGGYITSAVGRAAIALNIPLFMHESNAYPGLAIRSLNKKATKILLGFEKSKEFFKYKDNVEYVGNPINLKRVSVDKKKVLESLGLVENKKTILVFGGSQGAKKINDAIVPLIKKGYFNEFQLIFATGKNNYDGIINEIGNISKFKNIKILPYIYNMEEIINSCDIAITRAGAMTVSEILEVAIPTIFIPLPSQKANRQIDNAKTLENIGGAKIIKNEDLTADSLEEMLNYILKDNERLNIMKNNILNRHFENNSLEKIYENIEKYFNK